MYPATIDEAIETFPAPREPGERKKAFIFAPHPLHGGDWHVGVFVAQSARENASPEWIYRRAEVAAAF
jgi:hypothetical protein